MGDFFKNNRNQGGQNSNVVNLDPTETAKAKELLSRGIRRRVIVLGLFILTLILLNQCVVITEPNQYQVIQQFGEIKRITTQPGVSLKLPFIQSARVLPNHISIYDIPISDVITQDKKTMVVDSFVLWKVSDPTRFIRTLTGNVNQAEARISNISYNSMKNVISRMEQTEIISGRDQLAGRIFESIGDSLDQYGVDLVAIETKHLDLPDDNKQAVYTRMISERNNIAASYTAEGEEEARMIRNETDKTVSILLSQAQARAAETIALGEREYMEILAQAYSDPDKAEFYAYYRALEAAKEALGEGEATLILSSDSPIAQVFYQLQ